MRLPARFTLAMVMLAIFTTAAAGLVSYWYLRTPVSPVEPARLAEHAAGPVAETREPAQQARKDLRVVGQASMVVSLISAVLAVVLAARISRSLIRPLTQMSSAVQAFSRGEFLALPTRDDGPVGTLARDFEQMTAEIKAKTAALEAEVEERRRAEEALGGLISANPHAMIVTDAGGGVQLANDAAVDLLADELRRGPFSYPLQPGKTIEVEVARGGETVSAELCVVPIDWRGNPAFLAILTDITEQKKLVGQLRQAQKMEAVARMAGGVAHDFNNLMTVINMSRDLLLSDPMAVAPRAQRLLNEIRSAGDRATSLTSQLLAFSRKSAGVSRTVDLNAIVGELERLLQRLIGEDIELATVLEPAPCLLRADPSQLEQVIMNLAVNARDAMPTGGHLTIETHHVDLDQPYAFSHIEVQPGPYVELAVSDTGTGMSEEVKAHIFEPFFTTKAPGRGTGLGLATVYGIVQQMGGHITVYSELERGTTFRIRLPRRTAGVGSTPSAPPRFEIPTGDETILLVEDDAAIRQLTRLVLESFGYTVLEAENGLRALETAKAEPGDIDLVITDVIMPRMGGRLLMEPIRAARPGIKVLYMSGYTDETVERYGVIEADAPFIQKPFTPASLANKVRAVLDEPVPGCRSGAAIECGIRGV